MRGLHRPLTDARRIRVRGQAQGIGFRPFVWQLAARLGISGEVHNDVEGVLIHARGAPLDAFEAALRAEAPPLTRGDAVESAAADLPAFDGFRIVASGGAGRKRGSRPTPPPAPIAAPAPGWNWTVPSIRCPMPHRRWRRARFLP